eukprot:6034783-Amphidinium_carterae.1
MDTSSDASSAVWSLQDTPKLWERTLREEPAITGAGILCLNGCKRDMYTHHRPLKSQEVERSSQLRHLGQTAKWS